MKIEHLFPPDGHVPHDDPLVLARRDEDPAGGGVAQAGHLVPGERTKG